MGKSAKSAVPLWNRKRWILVPVLLAVAYPASLGPLEFCVSRRWVPYGFYRSYKTPALILRPMLSHRAEDAFDEYMGW